MDPEGDSGLEIVYNACMGELSPFLELFAMVPGNDDNCVLEMVIPFQRVQNPLKLRINKINGIFVAIPNLDQLFRGSRKMNTPLRFHDGFKNKLVLREIIGPMGGIKYKKIKP